MSQPGWSDFVSDFMALTESQISPALFKRWSAIALVAGALERRVFAKTGGGAIFPNLYTLLVAPPGVGKFVIETVRELWTETIEPGTKLPAFHVASDSVTNASLMDELVKAKSVLVMPQGPPLTYHSLLVAAEEFQVLLPAFDQQFIASLNSIYNNKKFHRESRRTGTVREVVLENPQLNILGGAQPAYFASTFPEEAWATGFARRVIMVYSTETPTRSLWFESEIEEGAREKMLAKLARLSQLKGSMRWHPAAAQALDIWHQAGGPPIPSHSKLAHYNRSRSVNSVKLATISAISRTGGFLIEKIDVERGLAWMIEVERLMPDIFREMIGRSDTQVIEEMHIYIMSLWAGNKTKPVDGGVIRRFLLQRVPHEKAETIIMAAEKANYIARVAGTQDLWVPRPKMEREVE